MVTNKRKFQRTGEEKEEDIELYLYGLIGNTGWTLINTGDP